MKKIPMYINSLKYKILAIIFCPIFLMGQNLVINPSFELYDQCPYGVEQFEGYVQGWSTFFGTPNYLNCDWFGVIPKTTAQDGNGFVSCIWIDIDNTPITREYLYGKLESPLIKDQWYYLYYWIFSPQKALRTKNFQALITQNQQFTFIDDVLVAQPTLTNEDYLEQNKWIKIEGCFQASGNENRIILGNFSTNENTSYLDTLGNSTSDFHYVDNIGLYEIDKLIPTDTSIIVGESIFFDPSLGREYEIAGEKVVNNKFFISGGIFIVDVYLNTCGYIGSFEIEVTSCNDYLMNLEPIDFMIDSIICIQDFIKFDFSLSNDIIVRENNVIQSLPLRFDELGYREIIFSHVFCGAIDTLFVQVIDCEEIEENSCFYVPNIITANDDQINDIFEISGNCPIKSYKMQIYDRWGNFIFYSDNIENSWTAEYVNSGVYAFVVEIEFIKENEVQVQKNIGSVTVIK